MSLTKYYFSAHSYNKPDVDDMKIRFGNEFFITEIVEEDDRKCWFLDLAIMGQNNDQFIHICEMALRRLGWKGIDSSCDV